MGYLFCTFNICLFWLMYYNLYLALLLISQVQISVYYSVASMLLPAGM